MRINAHTLAVQIPRLYCLFIKKKKKKEKKLTRIQTTTLKCIGITANYFFVTHTLSHTLTTMYNYHANYSIPPMYTRGKG